MSTDSGSGKQKKDNNLSIFATPYLSIQSVAFQPKKALLSIKGPPSQYTVLPHLIFCMY
jgi:hypothetical protein